MRLLASRLDRLVMSREFRDKGDYIACFVEILALIRDAVALMRYWGTGRVQSVPRQSQPARPRQAKLLYTSACSFPGSSINRLVR